MKKTLKDKFRDYVIDNTSSITFYTPIIAANEHFIGKLEPDEILESRLIMAAYQMAGAGRVQGALRDRLYQVTDVANSKIKSFCCDVASAALVYIPFYAGVLHFAGADSREIWASVPSGIAWSLVLSTPYSKFLDGWRAYWKKNEKDKNIESE